MTIVEEGVSSVYAAPGQRGAVAEYRSGDDKARKKKRGFLMGEAMKASKGQGNPQLLNRLLDENPAFVRGLLTGLTIRLADLTRRLAELTGARVEARFARLFLKLCEQIGRKERGGVFVPMPLSRQELADLTGTTIETAIRIMSRWQKDDVLHTEKDGFVVINQSALEDASTG